MEGPMMAMDKEVEKPETFGLPAGWSGFVGGMMTLVRVLLPEQYDKIIDLKAKQQQVGIMPIETNLSRFTCACLPVALGVVIFSSAWTAQAQQPAKKEYVFRGKVTRVDAASKQLTVANEPIEGWMGAMTMAFRVSNEDVLVRLKPGDQITAKVYEGDFTLYDVKVVPQTPGNVPATPTPPGVSLGALEQMALANNPSVAQAQANLRAAAGLAKQAGLYPNPTVGYYGDEIRGGYSGGGKQGGFVSQTIVLGGKLGAARRVAQSQANQIETNEQAQRLRVLNNVRSLFYQVLAAQRLVEPSRPIACTRPTTNGWLVPIRRCCSPSARCFNWRRSTSRRSQTPGRAFWPFEASV
jgi:Cu/Ag efflux protein CusF